MAVRPRVVVAIALLLASCGTPTAGPEGAEGPVLDAATLTERWGCGHGFAVSTPQQDVGLLLHLSLEDDTNMRRASRGEFDRTVELPHPDWRAEVQIGRRLFSEWCHDVAGPPDEAPVVQEIWEVTGGLLQLEDGTLPRCGGDDPTGAWQSSVVTATLEGLEVTPPDGEPIAVGDLELRNDGWGCYAG